MPRVIVIGAGAAGTMAAIFAARSGAETLLLERTRDGGRKILISGGGRCNVLPMQLDESRFVTDSSPNLLRKMVRAWPLAEQRAFFEQDLGIALVEEVDSSKLFPASHKARDVRDGLLAHAAGHALKLMMDKKVQGLVPVPSGGPFARARAGAPAPAPAIPPLSSLTHRHPPAQLTLHTSATPSTPARTEGASTMWDYHSAKEGTHNHRRSFCGRRQLHCPIDKSRGMGPGSRPG